MQTESGQDATGARTGGFVRLAARVETPGAPSLLRAAEDSGNSAADRPRGFWERDGTWSAFLGSAGEVRVAAGPDRFSRARTAGARLLGRVRTEDRGGSPLEAPRGPMAPRLYGGFSFGDGTAPVARAAPSGEGSVGAGPDWRGFPSALFFLPAVELRWTALGGWLFVTERVRPGEDGEEARRRTRERLREIGPRLRRTSFDVEVDADAEAVARPTGAGDRTDGGHADGDRADGDRGDRDRRRWTSVVETLLEEIRGGRVQKAVLARAVELSLDRPVDPVAVLQALRASTRRPPGGTSARPGAAAGEPAGEPVPTLPSNGAGAAGELVAGGTGGSVFPFLFEPDGEGAWVGASPELVAVLRSGEFLTSAVAGTIRRGRDAEEDEILARRLLESEKDRSEHAIGVEDVRERLEPLLGRVEPDREPRVLRLGRMMHLQTDVVLRVDPEVHVLELLERLHPTAAVNGRPREAAARLLAEHEAFDRGWYAGPVGWFDAAGEGEFAPGLRAALLRSGSAAGPATVSLFAGAGIVEGSEADREWRETALKMRPVRAALGLGEGEGMGVGPVRSPLEARSPDGSTGPGRTTGRRAANASSR